MIDINFKIKMPEQTGSQIVEISSFDNKSSFVLFLLEDYLMSNSIQYIKVSNGLFLSKFDFDKIKRK